MSSTVPACERDDLNDLLRAAPLLDGHNDLLWELRNRVGYDFDAVDIASPQPSYHTDLPRLRAGGVGAQFWSVYVPSDLPGHTAVTATLEQIDAYHAMVERYPDWLLPARTVEDVERAVREGKIASFVGVEGGHSIGCSLGALRMLFTLGARAMTLTHNHSLPWADAAMDAPRCGGLSGFGREVVREMNRLGMLVDLSHVAEATMNAALDVSEAPVVFTHSSARALTDHPRNVPDAVLSRLGAGGEGGGVCMVTFVPGFVNAAVARVWLAGEAFERDLKARYPDAPEEVATRLARWRADHPVPAATLSDVADHIEHVREVAGIDHVGIGGDFDGVEMLPLGLGDVSAYPALFGELRDRKWSRSELVQLAGGNVLRVLAVAQDVATRLRAVRPASRLRCDD